MGSNCQFFYLWLLCLFLSICTLLSSEQASNLAEKPPAPKPKRRLNKEIAAIHQARLMKQRLQQHPPNRRSKPLLIATFINAGNNISAAILRRNLEILHPIADMAVVIYAGDSPAITDLCFPTDQSFAVTRSIIHCKRAVISYVPGHKVVPKPLLYPELLHYLPEYSKTLLIDEDISLEGVNLVEYLTIWDCAFYPSPPPIVVQGLVAEPTQSYNFLHWSEWRAKNLSTIIASATDLVEQQIPAFDSLFLSWFIEHVMSYTHTEALKLESDWGCDGYWCAAARPFAHHVYGIPHGTNYTPCGLLINTNPFHHQNTRSLKTKAEKYQKYVQAGRKISKVWHRLFPSWSLYWADPTKAMYNHRYRKFYNSSSQCFQQLSYRNMINSNQTLPLPL